MLDERLLVEKLEELVARDEVVVFAVFLAGSRQTGGVCALRIAFVRHCSRKLARRMDGTSRETLKPNLSGYSAKRRLSRVLLPTPEGPDMRRGRKKSGRGDMAVETKEWV